MFGIRRKRLMVSWLVAVVGVGLVLSGCGRSETSSSPQKILVVTSTDFYGEVARAVIGNKGTVHAVINQAAVDPHDYEPTPKVAKMVHHANVVVANGIGYDSWMNRLVTGKKATLIRVGNDLLKKQNGDNPHLWYQPQTMPTLARALAKQFAKEQPRNKAYFEKNAKRYIASLKPIDTEMNHIKQLSSRQKQKRVYVSEPVVDYAIQALGFKVANRDFEEAIENGSDPSPKSIRQMQNGLRKHQVAFFVFNKQVDSKTVNNLVTIAKQNHVPVLKVTETLPDNLSYKQWMLGQYRQLAKIIK
ncbi:metal ABC transporter solute-binding protein [Secundilactobacillus mixtipabuli]|uniref:Metal ABC transporter substrate-binding protein n=1 Tax=Secundilactobacillus mixtipabuli TaxID=1435342 RepID=A0A1Z5ICE3_9LACO|nr:metal ABC transporter solute-binding protein [Secundilactobacillus mixtipabuli]GAW99443.1 metal ABC transporter substrate-binding protein [Secundilactobacillus mixtipabuli]